MCAYFKKLVDDVGRIFQILGTCSYPQGMYGQGAILLDVINSILLELAQVRCPLEILPAVTST